MVLPIFRLPREQKGGDTFFRSVKPGK